MRTNRSVKLLLCGAVLATVLVIPARAHPGLKTGIYECWTTGNGMYSYLDLKIRSGGRYVWQLNDETWKRSGKFERNGNRLRFTSGFLKRRGFKAIHEPYESPISGHSHMIYMYRGGWDKEDLKYDCGN